MLTACGAPLPAGPAQQGQAIVGGQADPGDPAIAALLAWLPDGGGFLCSGALLGPHTFLTAAHCALPLGPGTRAEVVRAPDAFANRDASLVHEVDEAVPHPDYDPRRRVDWSDIALLHLRQAAPPPYAEPNPVVAERLGLEGRPVRFVGYGITRADRLDDGQKRTVTKLDVQVASPLELREGALGGLTCSGDSGGPELFVLPDGREVVLAVTSRGDETCSQLGFDTRVDPFVATFILPFMAARGDAPSCNADGRCAPGCSPPDPDCPCAPDGLCNPACPDPAGDPDCPQSCLFDGGACPPGDAGVSVPAPAIPLAAPSSGCSSAPGPGLLALAALLGVGRRRRAVGGAPTETSSVTGG